MTTAKDFACAVNPQYNMHNRYVNGVKQKASHDVYHGYKLIGKFTAGVFYPAADYHSIPMSLMEWLREEYRLQSAEYVDEAA